jgi:nitrite reductase/ring-hydroxylating ferredoxin subunit
MLNTHLKLADLQERGCLVYQAETFPIAIFHGAGKLHAVDNRCPVLATPFICGPAGLATAYAARR